MKILVDMNLSPFWVPFLARHGFEAWHWSTVGRPSAPDSEILAFARTNNFIILTHDLDFGMLLAAQPTSGPSVIQVRAQNVLPTAIGEMVVRAIRAAEFQLQKGALVTVDPVKQRIRMLPI
jgi:predicted nuclease of predicted toxin-antitoxin system